MKDTDNWVKENGFIECLDDLNPHEMRQVLALLMARLELGVYRVNTEYCKDELYIAEV